MDPGKLSAAIKLSIEAALKSQETTVAEAVFVVEIHKAQLIAMALRTNVGPVIQPASILPPNGHRG